MDIKNGRYFPRMGNIIGKISLGKLNCLLYISDQILYWVNKYFSRFALSAFQKYILKITLSQLKAKAFSMPISFWPKGQESFPSTQTPPCSGNSQQLLPASMPKPGFCWFFHWKCWLEGQASSLRSSRHLQLHRNLVHLVINPTA